MTVNNQQAYTVHTFNATDTKALLRGALRVEYKRQYPLATFSVKAHKTANVLIEWIDGPLLSKVQNFVRAVVGEPGKVITWDHTLSSYAGNLKQFKHLTIGDRVSLFSHFTCSRSFGPELLRTSLILVCNSIKKIPVPGQGDMRYRVNLDDWVIIVNNDSAARLEKRRTDPDAPNIYPVSKVLNKSLEELGAITSMYPLESIVRVHASLHTLPGARLELWEALAETM